MGVTPLILGILLLVILVSAILFFVKKFPGFMNEPLVTTFVWGTVVVIAVLFVLIILKLVGVALPVSLP